MVYTRYRFSCAFRPKAVYYFGREYEPPLISTSESKQGLYSRPNWYESPDLVNPFRIATTVFLVEILGSSVG